ncbi:DEAD-box ATP-dependent RNA helicase, partial [Rhizophlyctis rosea]
MNGSAPMARHPAAGVQRRELNVVNGWESDVPDWDGTRPSTSSRPTVPPSAEGEFTTGSSESQNQPGPRRVSSWTPSPRNSTIERKLFGSHILSGINFDNYDKIPVQTMGYDVPRPMSFFDDASMHPLIKENIKLADYSKPTPIQKYGIPIVTAGRDLMACAQTGSGKTAAFLFPILSHAFFDGPPASSGGYQRTAYPLALIMAPTRELACQIFDEAKKFAYRSWVKPAVVYGGADTGPQVRQLQEGGHLLVATPGRLVDMIERGVVSLTGVKYLILDEADRMLDMGFEPSIRRIVEEEGMPETRQTLLFSATFPREIQILAMSFLKQNYIMVSIGRIGGAAEDIKQTILQVPGHQKRETLYKLLFNDKSLRAKPPSFTLVFVRTKRDCDSIGYFLDSKKVPVTVIHGDRSQPERERSLRDFKYGRTPVMIATDVAARGLDIPNVGHVINYDLPGDIDDYVHRIGRTGRAGNVGRATAFFTDV